MRKTVATADSRNSIGNIVLRNANFRNFLFGYIISLIGSSMVPLAMTFYILKNGGSAFEVGLVSAAESVAFVSFLLLGGVIADRFSKKTVMIVADAVRGVSESFLVLCMIHGTASPIVLCAFMATLGIAQAFYYPAMAGFLPRILDVSLLQAANGYLNMAKSMGRVGGPLLAGAIVGASSSSAALAFDALTFAFAIMLTRTIVEFDHRVDTRGSSLIWQMRQGWTEFSTKRWLWLTVTQFSVLQMVALAPFAVLGPITMRSLGTGPALWGITLAFQGVGAIVGGLSAMRLSGPRLLPIAIGMTSLFALPVLSLVVGPVPLVIDGAALLGGFGLSFFIVTWNTILQRSVRPDRLSRIAAYDWLGSTILLPVGYLLAGPFAQLVGTQQAALVLAASALCSSVLMFTVKDIRAHKIMPLR